MDAITCLRQDHKSVPGLLATLNGAVGLGCSKRRPGDHGEATAGGT